jgi:hypothetical protein
MNNKLNESLQNGNPYDFFSKIHEVSINRPESIGNSVLNDLLRNDAQDVKHQQMQIPIEQPKK